MISSLGWLVAGVFGVLLLLAAWGKARRDRWRTDLAAAYAARNDDAVEHLAAHFGGEEQRLWRRLLTARAALEESAGQEARARRDLEDVLASLQDAVLVVDDEGRLRFLNVAALRLFDLRIEDVLGAHLIEALPSFGLDSAMRAALGEGQSSEHELQLYSPRLRQVFLRVSPVFSGASGGARTGAVAIVQDLTELRRLERVRRDFVANASHELRTPIATIRALAETLEVAGDDPEAKTHFLPPLITEAERLSRLVSDLLDLARAEDAPTSPFSPTRLRPIVASCVERLRDKAARHQINIEWAGEGKNPCVEGDAASLEQVAFNLLDNALSYTPQGGQVRLDLRQSEGNAILEVADNGIGIPEDDLPRVFERFYRVDKARSRAEGGTGLGLAIVKHIIDNHGGHVEVESSVGKGTTFRVRLPLSDECRA